MDTPYSRIAMDFVGPFPRTKQGKRYIIVLMDYATRWPEAKAVSAPTSRAAVDVILDICNRFAVPKEILTDRGSHFVNAMLRNVYKRLRIHHITTTPYLPQTDGMVERFNGTLKSKLKRSLSTFHGQWDQALPFVLGEYHSSPCRATGLLQQSCCWEEILKLPWRFLRTSGHVKIVIMRKRVNPWEDTLLI